MFKFLFIAASMALLAGCGPPVQPGSVAPVDLNRADGECLVVVAIDMSGSFAAKMTRDGKAFAFLTRVVDNYFKNSIGDDDRLVIAQLSQDGRRPLLWEGKPQDLRRDFPSAAAFREFLLMKSSPGGSRLHDGISDALDYAMSDPGVAGGRTKSVLLALTDFEDNAPNPDLSEQRLVQTLTAFGRKGGIVGFYYLDLAFVPVWRRHLAEARIKSYVCEADIVSRPPLPSFE